MLRPLNRPDPGLERVAKGNGFSLHAGVSCEGHQKEKVSAGKARETALGHKRERSGGVPLCRYIARPAVAVPRLSLSSTGKVLYTLKARGSRFQFNSIQLARKPLRNSLVWSPERRTGSCRVSKVSEKDLQDQQCKP